MKIFRSPGPDKLHPRVLRELAEVICKPLAIIFHASIQLGVIPDDWKLANITAIYSDSSQLLAMSQTPIVCKILESIIRDQIVDYMKTNKLFSNKQFGFIGGRPTTLQLLKVLDQWTSILDRGGGAPSMSCILTSWTLLTRYHMGDSSWSWNPTASMENPWSGSNRFYHVASRGWSSTGKIRLDRCHYWGPTGINFGPYTFL